MADQKKPPARKDPTVSTALGDSSDGSHEAVPIHKAADYAGDREYRDMPDDEKPAPETVAQYEVLPDDK